MSRLKSMDVEALIYMARRKGGRTGGSRSGPPFFPTYIREAMIRAILLERRKYASVFFLFFFSTYKSKKEHFIFKKKNKKRNENAM